MLLPGLLYFEKKGYPRGVLTLKTSLSSLFILFALVHTHLFSGYFRFLLSGLLLCLAGDVFLALRGEKMFRYGLTSFLFGHILYIMAFCGVASMSQWTALGGLVGLLTSTCVYLWLRPHLGRMKVPVLIYTLAITGMFSAAWSVLGRPDLAIAGRIAVFAGAVLFYFSDVFVARDHFLQEAFLNRLIGLPMYYVAQFLLALSAGLLAPTLPV